MSWAFKPQPLCTAILITSWNSLKDCHFVQRASKGVLFDKVIWS